MDEIYRATAFAFQIFLFEILVCEYVGPPCCASHILKPSCTKTMVWTELTSRWFLFSSGSLQGYILYNSTPPPPKFEFKPEMRRFNAFYPFWWNFYIFYFSSRNHRILLDINPWICDKCLQATSNLTSSLVENEMYN